MTKAEVVEAIERGVPDARHGETLRGVPVDLNWEPHNELNPIQYRALGPNGGQHFIGVATQVGSKIISYGPKGC